MTMFDIATTDLAPRWTPTRIVRSRKKKENAELVEFGQTILNIELSDISASPLVKETGMWMRSSFARDRNIMTFKNDMLDRYRHLGDTLSGGGTPALRVFGGEHADGFSGIDMHIRFKRHDGSLALSAACWRSSRSTPTTRRSAFSSSATTRSSRRPSCTSMPTTSRSM